MPGSPNARRFVSVVLLLAAYCLVAAAIASAQTQPAPRVEDLKVRGGTR